MPGFSRTVLVTGSPAVARWERHELTFSLEQPCSDVSMLSQKSAINNVAMTDLPESGFSHPSITVSARASRSFVSSRGQTDGRLQGHQTCANVGLKVTGTSCFAQNDSKYTNRIVQHAPHLNIVQNSRVRFSRPSSFPNGAELTIGDALNPRQRHRSSTTRGEYSYQTIEWFRFVRNDLNRPADALQEPYFYRQPITHHEFPGVRRPHLRTIIASVFFVAARRVVPRFRSRLFGHAF